MEKTKNKRPYNEPQAKVIQLQDSDVLNVSLMDAYGKDEFEPTWQ